ncbi:LysR substrate-binding domain-containing protein [Massilia sp. TS11]|uniref:LysR substrate-binding domain-containing protein n=1 Tax=Massilia sp. TS11 TaxID=2908003 RepID=UPI001EDB3D73|nr:LysR substrate-binding domain-containing protein [Massilia sp. TS11]MCG2586798.1 LysR substrate-binding domain-containing protein [Massilia sp. TS11]
MTDPATKRFIRSHLKVRHLSLLVELGRHGSIAHAAEAAGLTQPAASKLLGELEYVLEVPLFQRLPRGVEPTEYGRIMIRRAGAALAEMEAAHEEILQGMAGIGGRVRVGAVLTPSARLLPAAVQLLKQRNARIQVTATVDTSKALVEQLRAGELDIVIGRILDPEVAPELQFEPITDEPHSLIVRGGHPWLQRPELSVAELARASWILPPPGLLRERLLALFLSHGVEPPSDVFETMALSMIPGLLMSSERVVALPPDLVRPYLDSGSLAELPVELGIKTDVYGIITRRQHRLAPAGQAMLQALRDTKS